MTRIKNDFSLNNPSLMKEVSKLFEDFNQWDELHKSVVGEAVSSLSFEDKKDHLEVKILLHEGGGQKRSIVKKMSIEPETIKFLIINAAIEAKQSLQEKWNSVSPQ